MWRRARAWSVDLFILISPITSLGLLTLHYYQKSSFVCFHMHVTIVSCVYCFSVFLKPAISEGNTRKSKYVLKRPIFKDRQGDKYLYLHCQLIHFSILSNNNIAFWSFLKQIATFSPRDAPRDDSAWRHAIYACGFLARWRKNSTLSWYFSPHILHLNGCSNPW